ncbi:sigma-70 family RNA polymerase sigma factor [bacterium AH-315-N03]|nr:sigma-70 family RNA polymerase sigma factor [bacterium AH-315-N03]
MVSRKPTQSEIPEWLDPESVTQLVERAASGSAASHGEVYEALVDIVHGRSEAIPTGQLARWLRTRVRWRLRDEERRARRTSAERSLDLDRVASGAPSPEDNAIKEDYLSRVARAMPSLPRNQRDVIELSFFVGLRTDEIVDAMGLVSDASDEESRKKAVANVWAWRSRGLAKLRVLVREDV